MKRTIRSSMISIYLSIYLISIYLSIYLVSAALEWLCEKNDQIKHDMEEAAKKKKEEEEEEERKKLEGTKVEFY